MEAGKKSEPRKGKDRDYSTENGRRVFNASNIGRRGLSRGCLRQEKSRMRERVEKKGMEENKSRKGLIGSKRKKVRVWCLQEVGRRR